MAELSGRSVAAPVTEIAKPPQGLGEMIKFLGPGMALAAVLIGSGEAVQSPWIGAQVGFVYMWVIPAVLIIKWFMNELVGRYTIVTGETIFEGFTKVPGPWGWPAHIQAITNYGKITFTYGSIISLSAQVVQFITKWDIQLCVFLIIASAAIALLSGKFDPVAMVLTALMGVMILFAFYGGAVAISVAGLGTWLGGLVPNLGEPKNQWLILGMYGYIGGATSNCLYSWWIRDKGIGAVPLKEAGVPIQMTPTNVKNLQGWMKLMHVDLGNGYFWTAAVSVVFYTAAATWLQPQGLVATGLKAIEINSNIWAQISTLGVWLYLAGVFAALWSSIAGQWDGSARAMTDWWEIFAIKRTLSESGKHKVYLAFVAFFIVGGGLTATFVKSPVQLIALMAIFDSAGYLISTLGLAWLCRVRLPKEFRIGGLWLGFTLVAIVSYLFVMLVADLPTQIKQLNIF